MGRPVVAAYKVLFKSRWDRNVLVWILWLTELSPVLVLAFQAGVSWL